MKLRNVFRNLFVIAFLSINMIAFTNMSQPVSFGKGHILVQPAEGVTDDELNQIVAAHGGKSHSKIQSIKVHKIKVPEGTEEKIAAALSHNPKIKFAEVDKMVRLEPNMTTNDSYYASQWHLGKINAPVAWDTATGTNVIIAILDTGVNGAHPDLAGHMVQGFNFFDNTTNTSDVYGHGTLVAGAAAAIGNNTIGVSGVAWNSKIMPMRISDLSGNITYYSIVANALTWAADHGARVANISYGVNTSSAVVTAAQYMQSKGGVVFNSAGNSGLVENEANVGSIITVSATDANDVLAGWSSRGAMVDIAAPGVGIWTTNSAGGYSASNGTSFSSPIAAGVAALMLSANSSLTPQMLESILKSTAVDLGAAGTDQLYGSGRINAAEAVAKAKAAVVSQPPPTQPTPPPPVTDTVPPVISSVVPSDSSIVKGTVAIKGMASDNVAVVSMKLYIDGVLSASSTSGTVSLSWNTRKASVGSHSIRVDAVDAAGNSVTKTVLVRK